MFILWATLSFAAGTNARADLRPCVGGLSASLRVPDPLGEYLAHGTFSPGLVERIRAVRAAGERASTDRRAELDRAAEVLDQLDHELNQIPGGDDAPWNSLGSGRGQYAIYRGLRGNTEIITIHRFYDRFRWEIEAGTDRSGQRWLMTTGLSGLASDAREAMQMTAHRFPARR